MLTFTVDPIEGFRVEYVQNSSYAGQIIFRIVSDKKEYTTKTKEWVTLYLESPNENIPSVDNRLRTLNMKFMFQPDNVIKETRILLDELETFLLKLDDRFNQR